MGETETTKIDTKYIYKALHHRFMRDARGTFKPFTVIDEFLGIDCYIFGNWAKNRNVISFEIKVSRNDFMNDIKKFHSKQETALKYSTQFYYICPTGLIQKDEVPQETGLMYVGKNYTIRTAKIAPIRQKIEFFDSYFVQAVAKRLIQERDDIYEILKVSSLQEVMDANQDIKTKLEEYTKDKDEKINELWSKINERDNRIYELSKYYNFFNEFETL